MEAKRLAEPPVADFVRPSDAAMPKCIEALAGVIGAEKAALPSWQRRLALDGTTGEVLLLLDCPVQWFSPGSGEYLVAPEAGPRLSAWLACTALAFSVDVAVALLGSTESPEAELKRRREVVRVRDEIRAARQAEKDAKAEIERKAQADAEERRVRFREGDWDRLSDGQRLVLSVSLAIEGRDPALASELHSLALAPGLASLPRTQWWLPKDARNGE